MKIIKEDGKWIIEATRFDWEKIGFEQKWIDKKNTSKFLPSIPEKPIRLVLKQTAKNNITKKIAKNKIAKKIIITAPQTIKKAQNTFQNNDPQMPNFRVDLSGRGTSILSKSKINKALHGLGNYFKEIPLNEITEILKNNEVILLQEDGTPWSGFVMSGGECGSEKANKVNPFTFDLGVKKNNNYLVANNKLIMSVCTMPSGKLEVIMYIS